MTERASKNRKPAASTGGQRVDMPVRITDTTLRDAHQSLWATRMRTADILGIVELIDQAGYYSLEVWGGATFDVCLRFLRENPWERLRQIKSKTPKTPLQMLLRGQNILGYRNYADDVLDRFIALACENGIDIFRIFDALNDNRNLEHAIRSVKQHGGHAQGTLCYTISPVHTVDAYVKVALEQVDMGIDSLCIKDMAGILSPVAAEQLVGALTRAIHIPVQIHSHATSGMAPASYLEGVKAGAGAIDCAISSMAGFSSQPPVETMLSIFDETPWKANLDRNILRQICKYFADLAPDRQPAHHPPNIIDPEILLHHIPGGMISNLRSQLDQQGALDKLDQVLEELPRTRADMGYPPLVTPTSQIVGVQAVMNILSGERYSLVPQETRDYVKGLYGRSPAPIDPAISRKILGNEKPVTGRPADLLGPMLPTATRDLEPGLVQAEEDIISYCLFPEQALEYFKWRKLPEKERPKSPADVEIEKKLEAKTPTVPPPKPLLAPSDYLALHTLIDRIHALNFSEVTIRRQDVTLSLKAGAGDSKPTAETTQGAPAAVATPKAPAEPAPSPVEPAGTNATATDGPAIKAPLNGTFYLSSGPGKPPLIKVGDVVKAGSTVCIVEAMKLFNQIKAPADATIVQILLEHGKPVKKDQPMIVYKPAS